MYNFNVHSFSHCNLQREVELYSKEDMSYNIMEQKYHEEVMAILWVH